MRTAYSASAIISTALLVAGVASSAVPQQPVSSSTPGVVGTQSQPASQEPILPLSAEQVVAHLGKTAQWYHHLEGLQQLQLPAEVVARDRPQREALAALRLALEAGRASAALLNARSEQAGAAAPSNGLAGRLDQAAANISQRINTLQSQLDAFGRQLTHARAKERQTLLAQKAEVSAALGLAREVQQSLQDMENFAASSVAGDKASLSPLEGQIADIEHSVPELRASSRVSRDSRAGAGADESATSGAVGGSAGASGAVGGGGSAGDGGTGGGNGSKGSANASAGPSGSGAASRSISGEALRIESAGVIPLISDWLALTDTRGQLDGLIKDTGELQDEIGKMHALLVEKVRDVVDKDLSISSSTDQAKLLSQRAALEEDSNHFKQLSRVLVPLAEQSLVVQSVRSTLGEWRTALEARMAAVARYLALRIGIVLGGIVVVLVISDIWRRATFRYLHDLRRRRQFLVLRRVVVGVALTLVIVFGLVSEIGSLATYIGFVTAGIAVALQNVILAIVAYFFLIGRYGVRVGDRVTLSGVTGRVVDIGLMRVYLMELAGADLHVTGRMVVLSNAVLFQPTALFKQIPGADYDWHTATLTIAATADVAQAHKRLQAAAEQVYEKYRAAIDQQHATMQRFMEFESAAPHPEVRVRLSGNGLECSVRYPVELDNAAVIDQQMLKALRDALEHDSQFKLVSADAVVLKSSDG